MYCVRDCARVSVCVCVCVVCVCGACGGVLPTIHHLVGVVWHTHAHCVLCGTQVLNMYKRPMHNILLIKHTPFVPPFYLRILQRERTTSSSTIGPWVCSCT